MKTYVTYKDYNDIKRSFTEEEIRLKYGRLIVISEENYREMKKQEKKTRN